MRVLFLEREPARPYDRRAAPNFIPRFQNPKPKPTPKKTAPPVRAHPARPRRALHYFFAPRCGVLMDVPRAAAFLCSCSAPSISRQPVSLTHALSGHQATTQAGAAKGWASPREMTVNHGNRLGETAVPLLCFIRPRVRLPLRTRPRCMSACDSRVAGSPADGVPTTSLSERLGLPPFRSLLRRRGDSHDVPPAFGEQQAVVGSLNCAGGILRRCRGWLPLRGT